MKEGEEGVWEGPKNDNLITIVTETLNKFIGYKTLTWIVQSITELKFERVDLVAGVWRFGNWSIMIW